MLSLCVCRGIMPPARFGGSRQLYSKVFTALLFAATAATADPVVRIDGADVPLQPVEDSTTRDAWTAQFLIVAENLPPANTPGKASAGCNTGGTAAAVSPHHLQAFCDLTVTAGTDVAAYESAYAGRTSTGHGWIVHARFPRRPPEHRLRRHVSALIDGHLYLTTIAYTLPARSATQLNVEQPAERWVVENGRGIGVQIKAVGASRPSIRVVESSLQDTETSQRINASDFTLCVENTCASEVLVPGNESTSLSIRLIAGNLPIGEFSGNLVLAADQVAVANPIRLTVLSSSVPRRWTGAGLILLGVLAAWFITVLAPHRAKRLEALRPATILREAAEALQRRLTTLDVPVTDSIGKTKAALENIISNLQERTLTERGYIAGSVPRAIRSTDKPAEAYEGYLQEQADRLSVLALLTTKGIEPIATDWTSYQAAGVLAQAKQALKELDALSDRSKPEDIDATVSHVIQTLANSLSSTARSHALSRSAAKLTSATVTATLERIQTGVWLIWLAITVLSGCAALILTDAAFGTLRDLFACFAWGLGLQVVGPQLSQLTVGKVAVPLNVNIPTTK